MPLPGSRGDVKLSSILFIFVNYLSLQCRSNNSKENGVVLPSFSGGSEVILQPGVGIVPVNGSQVSHGEVV